MSEQTDSRPDSRTDAQRFEDALRGVLSLPKQKVDAIIAEEKAERKMRKGSKEANANAR